jgi:hypothetical protein
VKINNERKRKYQYQRRNDINGEESGISNDNGSWRKSASKKISNQRIMAMKVCRRKSAKKKKWRYIEMPMKWLAKAESESEMA